MQVVAAQIFRDEVVEPVFALFRRELLHQRQALGERDIGGNLSAKRPVANRFEPGLQGLEHLALIQIGKLLPEALEVAKGVLIDKADQPKKLQQGILQRSGRQQQLV